jgi:hypothetical protein
MMTPVYGSEVKRRRGDAATANQSLATGRHNLGGFLFHKGALPVP